MIYRSSRPHLDFTQTGKCWRLLRVANSERFWGSVSWTCKH